ncbi:MAG: class I SAM-dependent methyltransferase [Tepidiformaceae bacterium]
MSSEPAQGRISEFWSLVAPGYEAHAGNVLAEGTAEHAAWVEEVRSLLPAAPSDVLDVGCGTGFMARTVAGLGHRVTGIDLAPAMLEAARQDAARRELAIDYRSGDATSPPFEPGTWDVITSRHLLWTLREPEVAFANWRRLLRPGGRVVAIDGFWFSESAEPAPQDAESEQGPFEQHYDAATRAALPFMHATDMGPVADTLRRAGFERVEVRRLKVATVEGNPPWAVVAFP